MLKIGILADHDEEREAIAHAIELLTAREGFECFVYSICTDSGERRRFSVGYFWKNCCADG